MRAIRSQLRGQLPFRLLASRHMPLDDDPQALQRALRQSVDAAISTFLAAQRERMRELAPASAALVDMIELILGGGGKRLRPMLCYLAYRASGGPEGPEILTAAGSLELLHTFAILHDDVMDQALLRRGLPALHRRLADERRGAGHPNDADTYGVSVAVLAGDLALVLSDAMMASSGFDKATVARALVPLEEMRVQAVAGQYLDILQAGDPSTGPEEAARIARLKTAGYSVVGPVAVGTALADPPPAVAEALARYARAVGEAFFLRDEVLGLFAEAEETGKDAESDLRRGKPTTLVADAVARSPAAGRQVIERLWGNPEATIADLGAVREIVEASGALGAATRAIGALVDEAVESLGEAALLEARPGQLLAGLAERLR
ncbi:MAG: Polyprenyl synthetase [Actinobacteria bacterium]|nr:Polyprenyl synthetase [Actinomycetota bacterium]